MNYGFKQWCGEYEFRTLYLKPNYNFKEELFSNWWRKEIYEETRIRGLDFVTLWAPQASYCNSYEPQNIVSEQLVSSSD